MKKYELTSETKFVFGRTVHRIRALVNFTLTTGEEIKAGELGGWIEGENNLSQDGKAWVFGEARVFGEAQVFGEARVSGKAQVFGEARVFGKARVFDEARVSGEARVFRADHTLIIGPVGSRVSFMTFFRTKNREIWVSCGCFLGGIDAFLQKVQETHGDNKHARVYRAAVEFAKECIDLEADEPKTDMPNGE